jgi:predicted NBD/HSP70 family sugar kinase
MTTLHVDVGGTRTKYAAPLHSAQVIDTPDSWQPALQQVVTLTRQHNCTELALALPGLIDPAQKVWITSTALGANQVDLDQWFRDRHINLQVVSNDVAAAATGEAKGATLALLQIGTGIGSRYVAAGTVVTGHSNLAGEIGHLVIDPAGPLCRCGKRGCLEATSGWNAIQGQLLSIQPDLTPHPAQLIDPNADTAVKELSNRVFQALGQASAALVTLADPGELRLGGGLATAWSTTGAHRIKEAMAAFAHPEVVANTRVTLSTLADNAALEGLALLAARSSSP